MTVTESSDTVRAGGPPPSLLDPARLQALAAEMIERERWPREALLEYQRARLREVVERAVAGSPYYHEAIGHLPAGEITLAELPILTKTTLMEQFDRIVTDRRVRLADVERRLADETSGELILQEHRAIASGGTTGQRGVVVYDREAWELTIANVLRWMASIGITPETRVLGIGAPTALHISNRMFAELRAARIDAPRLAVTTPLPQVVLALNAYRPEFLITYPSFMRRLAEEQLAGRLRIFPKWFSSAAETLTRDVRDLVRDTWGAALLDSYCTTETGLIGVECPWNAGVHVAEDLLVFEVVDPQNRAVAPGVAGHKVLVTTLFNRVLPLIRYEISDLVTLADGPCGCGRPHLRLASIGGRREELLSLPSREGGRVAVHALQLREPLLRLSGVRQFQLEQRPEGIHVRLAVRQDRQEREELLQSVRRAVQTVLDQIGASVATLTVEAVDHIERAGTGAKERLVKARIDPRSTTTAPGVPGLR